jgi:alpha-glucosidase
MPKLHNSLRPFAIALLAAVSTTLTPAFAQPAKSPKPHQHPNYGTPKPSLVDVAKQYHLSSPDNNSVQVTVNVGEKITYTLANKERVLLENNSIQLKLRGKTLGVTQRDRGILLKGCSTEIKPAVPFKFSTVKSNFNALILKFADNYIIEFRAFDDGFAYRLLGREPGTVDVLDEDFGINFPAGTNYLLHYQNPERRGLATCYEEPYSHTNISDLKSWVLLPLLIDTKKGPKIFVSETDVLDYPNTFFKKTNGNGLQSFYPPVPATVQPQGGRYIRAVGDAGYIARTTGTRTYPWRYFIITKNDKDLLENTIGAQLAPKCAIADTSWIKPGLSVWDWMNRGAAFPKETGFKSRAVNTLNAKLYIDYAARNKIPYYIIDEGWSVDNGLPEKVKPALDLPEVIRYGNEKGVRVVLWITYLGIQRDFDDDSYNLFEHFSKMGIAGFKIDFMDRSDQDVVNFYERAAAEAAKYKMIVELHGSYKPAGLEYKYPNILSYEGVLGMENHLGCKPDNSLYLPFLRNVTGPMSFTPGSLINVQPEKTKGNFKGHWPMIGTRTHHIAYYILFESGLQMIADSPVLFDQNPDCAKFIYGVPVTWDETRALAAEVGQYALSARRHGSNWWIGGITNNAKKSREFGVTLDFLDAGKDYTLTSFEDGPNADTNANDYKLSEKIVRKGDKIQVKFARNGGYAAVLKLK